MGGAWLLGLVAMVGVIVLFIAGGYDTVPRTLASPGLWSSSGWPHSPTPGFYRTDTSGPLLGSDVSRANGLIQSSLRQKSASWRFTGSAAIRGYVIGAHKVITVSDVDRSVELAKERGYDALAPIDEALERGEITQAEWHARILALVEPAYLSATTEQMGSGHSGTREQWEQSRGLIMEAINGSGTFLDVGCANGLLMASVERWSRERGLVVEPYGVEISPRLADLARSRYPQWRDRIWAANADGWQPPMRFQFVRSGLEYVPVCGRETFVRHLLDNVVAPGGRLIVGKNNENRGESKIADSLRSWGWSGVQEVRRPHDHPGVEISVVWLDHL